MCLGSKPSPAMPAPVAAPPAVQEVKAPERQAVAAKATGTGNLASVKGGRISGGTLLTGPSGIDNSMLSTGKTMLGQ